MADGIALEWALHFDMLKTSFYAGSKLISVYGSWGKPVLVESAYGWCTGIEIGCAARQDFRHGCSSPRQPGLSNRAGTIDESQKLAQDPTYSPNFSKNPLQPEYNILRFIAEHSKGLEEWERNLLLIVEESSKYFIPQALTKVMNEGWACTIHYKIINELNLPDSLHLPFIKLHNQVVRPHLGQLNPYHLGFKLFEKIIEKEGFEESMIVREVHNDISFLRFYCDQEFMQEMNYFSYSFKKDKKSITIDDVSDEAGWETVRDELIKNVGLSRVPIIFVDDVEKDNTLCLSHEHDGRDLDLSYAQKVFDHIKTLWKDNVKLVTVVENEVWEF